MKVFSVIGLTKSGKTTTIENIIKELRKRNYTVGSVKEIHFEKFKMDVDGTNTHRHKMAGSQLVTARGAYETDVLFQRKLSMNEILCFYNHDFVILEGVRDTCAPKIVTAHDVEGIIERLDETTFAISGQISNSLTEYEGIPVINSLTEIEKLVDLIEKKVFDRLPDMKDECCKKCGYTCTQLCSKILKCEAERRDCVLAENSVTLKINGQEIAMNPFVQNILKNTVEAIAKELYGYTESGDIEVCIKR
ncbi:MAG TPA: molybdopterin-guanine dinucleotide biosynthesis protein MobB [Sedimentibacter sp.]|jgi:molybdopterin-guanine dinucleotide biosynthesis protein B|nr:molybdopterin-guanine dinucleotide biosynthesis protein MobB [Sedimentibacter sp.]NLA14534.1 molybdopterin-guanine dinucleotide biosynthesis protein [Tissierellia bacterium]HOA19879.1 molybdopterin-guanine dinucleotide biosynthesis protein MobB [Sedimentibacter sp.]HOG62054.1 molybdopterin-guanine dinucleotide biosynthesis protein MobB [Sedimentibacter sp.]HPB78774.1 molybdopterin-guanine dinucleotide biosynthesis protein MobB [Sedimentibacter sp.]